MIIVVLVISPSPRPSSLSPLLAPATRPTRSSTGPTQWASITSESWRTSRKRVPVVVTPKKGVPAVVISKKGAPVVVISKKGAPVVIPKKILSSLRRCPRPTSRVTIYGPRLMAISLDSALRAPPTEISKRCQNGVRSLIPSLIVKREIPLVLEIPKGSRVGGRSSTAERPLVTKVGNRARCIEVSRFLGRPPAARAWRDRGSGEREGAVRAAGETG